MLFGNGPTSIVLWAPLVALVQSWSMTSLLEVDTISNNGFTHGVRSIQDHQILDDMIDLVTLCGRPSNLNSFFCSSPLLLSILILHL